MWELRGLLGSTRGSGEGLDLARRLWLGSLKLAPPALSPDLTLDLLQLDDDDGDLSDGAPDFEEIARAFGDHGLPPPGEIVIEHAPLPDAAGPGPFEVEAAARPGFAPVAVESLTLRTSIDGGVRYADIPMTPSGGGLYRASIPPAPDGTTVRYYLEAAGTGGVLTVLPAGAPRDETFAFAVGEAAAVFADSFDGPETGWTHGLTPNGQPGNRDDWERGTPGRAVTDPEDFVPGELLDPPAAFSPPNCWGNDISRTGRTDKNYPVNSLNWLESPPVDCRGRFGLHLRFRRWLTVERADRARLIVNGSLVWQSPSDRDTVDVSWRLLDHDVSSLADDREGVTIRFELASDSKGVAGGWTVDDVALVATGKSSLRRPEVSSIDPAFDFKTGGAAFAIHGIGVRGRRGHPGLPGGGRRHRPHGPR